jgi:RNA polymerase sigma-70 factor, ECF subfamily
MRHGWTVLVSVGEARVAIEGKAVGFDGELLRIVQEGSRLEQKVSKLFELLRDPVYRYLALVLGNQSDAEDLTQEVFLRLYTRLAKGQRVENVRAWLFRVAQNLAVDLLRKKHRLEPVEPEVWAQLSLERRDPSPSAEQKVLDQERRQTFLMGLQRLSSQERHCLYLRIEGLSYSEIAEVLGISATTVPTFLSRGIKKLRKTHE